MNPGLEFWANVKLLNQRLGYTERKSKNNPAPNFKVPTIEQIKNVFQKEGLDHSKLINEKDSFTIYGQKIIDYMNYRRDALNNVVKSNLMTAAQAEALFNQKNAELQPPSHLIQWNRQKGAKRKPNYLACLVNMIVNSEKENFSFNHDPQELTAITQNNYPIRTLSRRVDGAFPAVIDPVAIWEIKEYYYTTTFGSRISDGVYVTMLDAHELEEIYSNLKREIKHYLFVDAYDCWWELGGKSYLCRLIDIMHMGLVDEVVFGKEVLTRLPILVKEWINIANNNLHLNHKPKHLGKHNNLDVLLGKNKHTYYVQYTDGAAINKCVMIPENTNPENINLDEAIKILNI